jgi:hypothetical protein
MKAKKLEISARRTGKTLAAVELTKADQGRGKTVLWATADQASTAALLARHGALSEVVGEFYLKPKFRKPDGN